VSSARIASLVDEGTFEETDANLISVDTLKFKGVATYEGRMIENMHVDNARRAIAMAEAIAQLQS